MRNRNCCSSPEHRLSRRSFLFGAAQASAFFAAARQGDGEIASAGAQPRGRATACIFVTLNGAPSHVDTWDPKDGPWNPADARLRQYSGGMVLSQTLFPTFSQLTSDLLFLRSV